MVRKKNFLSGAFPDYDSTRKTKFNENQFFEQSQISILTKLKVLQRQMTKLTQKTDIKFSYIQKNLKEIKSMLESDSDEIE